MRTNLRIRIGTTIAVIFAFFLLSTTFLSSFVNATPDGNNYFDSAESITAPYSKTDSLDSTDDESDFYSIYLTSASISITLDVPSTGDFDIYIYDWEYFNETGYAIYASETENDPESILFTPSEEGVYYIEIYAYSGFGQYTLSIASQSVITDGNDNIHSATLTNFGSITSEISQGDIYDYFKYNCTSLGTLSITLIGPSNSYSDFDLALYNPSFVKVAASESDTSFECINYTIPRLGFYYVLVYAYSGNGSYLLDVKLNVISGEQDDDWNTARSLPMPSTITDTLSRGFDNNDYFKFNAKRGDAIYLNLTSPTGADFDLYLYDDDFSILAKSENTTTEDRIFEKFASEGTYYLRVYAYSGLGQYSLQTSIIYAGSNGVSANIKSNATLVKVGEPVKLDASSSTGSALSYSWDFDASDGITTDASSVVVVKAWNNPGTYIVTLDVFDRNGNTDSTTITITVVADSNAALPEWTFMVFLNADNNLEGAGITDLNEMETIGSTSNVNIVVQIDRNPNYDSSNGDTTGVRRYFVKRDSNPSTITSPVLSYLGELNMGSPDVLADFVKWAVFTYPAKKYCLVIWDHGGGINGASYDETSGDDALEPIELKNALLNAQQAGVPKIDLLGFDACLMANIEVAYELSTTAKYMVASEETEPGDGWPYNAILGALATTPTMEPLELGKNIVDSYKQFYESAGDYKNTMCVLDLTKINPLCAKVNLIADILLSGLESSYSDSYVTKIKNARNSVSNYYSNTHVDLGHIVYLLSSIDAVKSASTDFTSLKNDVVVYNYAGSANANSKGLSIYFPKSKSPKSCSFNDIFHWDNMVMKYLTLAGSSSDWPWRGYSDYTDYRDYNDENDAKKEKDSVISGIFSTSSKPIQGTQITLTLKLSNLGYAVTNAEVEVCESIPNAKNSTVFVERKGFNIGSNGTTELYFNWTPKYSWEVELCARIYPQGNNQTVYATIKQQVLVTTSGPDISGEFRNDFEYAIDKKYTNI
ncbi:MAG: clostripain-related cysteine peptidase, partial [Thermoplasmata archaeon]